MRNHFYDSFKNNMKSDDIRSQILFEVWKKIKEEGKIEAKREV